MNNKSDTKKPLLMGGAAECGFFSKLMKLGYAVYIPLVDAAGVDCVATKDHLEFLQFQVKSSTKGTNYALIKIPKRPNYFFVFHCFSINKLWLIPSTELIRIAKLDTPIKRTGEKTYRISLTRSRKRKREANPQYDKYLEENGLKLIE